VNGAGARARLLDERAETLRRLGALARDFAGLVATARDAATDDEHDPEGATLAFERAGTAALLEQARDHLADVDRALERLAAGTYATCERCGRPIGRDRLAARPVARTCLGCASSRR
jgi:DnaK suppressor protein